MYYNKYIWHDGDIISAAKLNHIETGIKDISDLIDGSYNNNTWEKSDVVSVDRLNNIEDGIEDLVDIINKKDIMPLSVVPSEQEQIFNDSSIDGYKPVTVSAISSTYIGSGITQRDSSSLSASGDTVLVPSGYYGSNASKSVASGTAGIPIATKGTVSNHSISVTPSVTNTTGYITGSTKTGTAVKVSASELVSGTKSISTNGTDIDVTNYSKVDVSVPTGGSPVINSLSVTPSTSEQTFNSSSVDGYKPVTVAAVSSGKLISGGIYISDTVNISVSESGEITAQSGAVWLDSPVATDGWLTSSDNIYIQAQGFDTYQLSTQAGTTVTPTTSEQTIVTAGKYTTGAIKVSAMPTGTSGTPTATKGSVSNHSVTITPSVTNTSGYITGGTKTGTAISVSASELVSGNKSITSNGTNIDVTNYETVSVNVEGGGTPGDNLEYGLTDGTLAIIGVGKIGSASI